MITMTLETEGLLGDLTALQRDQLPYATMRGIDATLHGVQDAEQHNIEDTFTIRSGRSRRYLLDSVFYPREARPTKTKLEGQVAINPKRPLLMKFEDGGPLRSADPMAPNFIPSENIRPSVTSVVPRKLYPKNLRLMDRKDVVGILPAKVHYTKRGVRQIKGKERTFVLDPRDMFGVSTWGVYQRTGPGKHDVRLLWRYKTEIDIPAILDFIRTGTKYVDAHWEEHFMAAFDEAMRTAR